MNSAALRTNGSNSLALNQLVPKQPAAGTSPSLDPMLPSIAEALAVMAGCTLFMSARDAPFVIETWVSNIAVEYMLFMELTLAELHFARQYHGSG